MPFSLQECVSSLRLAFIELRAFLRFSRLFPKGFCLRMPAKSSRLHSQRWALFSGVFLLFLGLAVVIGWHEKQSDLSHINPSFLSMKYNTAWAFFFLGSGLVAQYFSKIRIALSAGVVVISMGILTLIQYLAGVSLGIDEWIVKDIVANEMPYPGRMSPLTALFFIFAGAMVLMASLSRRYYAVILILGTISAATGTVSALNYLGAASSGYSWWQQIGYGVPIHTATAMTLAGIAFISLSWRHWNQKTCTLCVPLMLFVSMLTLTFLLWQGMVADEIRSSIQNARGSNVLPSIVLVVGFLLSALLAAAGYLAQTAGMRATELMVANQKLKIEIAERVLTQKSLSEARQELIDFMETATVGLYWLDKSGLVLWANPAEYRLLGYTRDEYVGQLFSKFYVNTKLANGLLERMNRGEALDSVEVPLLAKNGDIKQLLISSQPFYKKGELIHTRCFSRDITKQKSAEQALRQNMDRFRLSLDNSLDAFVVIDDQGLVIEWSAQAEMMFGWSRDEILNTPMDKTIIPGRFRAAHKEGMERFLKTGQGPLVNKHIELIAMKRKGEEFPIELSIVPIKWEDSYIFSSFIHDITERKQVQRDLEIYMQKLIQSNRELQEFASISSHDLQEPLRKIRAFGERLNSSHKTELSPQAQDYISRMQNAAARMQNLINDLLMYSQVTSRARPFIRVDLAEVVREVLGDLEVQLDKTQAKIDVGTLPTIVADKIQMQQLFQNLISNALKFHKLGQVPEITISSRYTDNLGRPAEKAQPYGYVEITVKDQGIGFDMKYAEQIFSTFQRLHTRKEYEGTGIGLAICRKIAAHHSGSIIAKSELDNGSEFVIKLPVDPVKGRTNAA